MPPTSQLLVMPIVVCASFRQACLCFSICPPTPTTPTQPPPILHTSDQNRTAAASPTHLPRVTHSPDILQKTELSAVYSSWVGGCQGSGGQRGGGGGGAVRGGGVQMDEPSNECHNIKIVPAAAFNVALQKK